MFCPELIASLSFTPVAAGVIFLPILTIIQNRIVQILRNKALLLNRWKRI
jgi:hypothetical protein